MNYIMKSRHCIRKESKEQGEEVYIINSTILYIILVLAEVADCNYSRLWCKALPILINLYSGN